MTTKRPFTIKPDTQIRKGLKLIVHLLNKEDGDGFEHTLPGITPTGILYIRAAAEWIEQYTTDVGIEDAMEEVYDPWGDG